MTIDANTKIAAILRESPAALETIISLSPRFARLRNPVLRKLMAGRTTVAMASRIGGYTVRDFLRPLEKLGFTLGEASEEEPAKSGDGTRTGKETGRVGEHAPDVQSVIELDVRPILSAGGDPLGTILNAIQTLEKDNALKIINSFEPQPLISLLEKKGFSHWTDRLGDHLVHTWFYRKDKGPAEITAAQNLDPAAWQATLDRFAGKRQNLDVRELPMPLPMTTILESLDRLPPGNALFVEHKRIPVFLLPELAEQGFDYRILEKSEAHVQLLIFKKDNP